MEILIWTKKKLTERKRTLHTKTEGMKVIVQKNLKEIFDILKNLEKNFFNEIDEHQRNKNLEIETELD